MHTDTADGAVVSGPELMTFDATAVRASVSLVERMIPADLARPTPCTGWTLQALLEHLIAQHHGFAAAAAGQDGPAHWKLRPLGRDPVQDYRDAAAAVLAAFAADGVLDRAFALPEITTRQPFPAAQAISFHFVDYVVHSWDLARTLGVEIMFGPGLLTAALAVARAVPQGQTRLVPGASFAPPVPGPHRDGLDEIIALLGRSPGWPS